MNESEKPNERQLILYQTEAGTVRIEVLYQSDTFWLNQKKIAELFGVDLRTVSYHLGEIYASGELSQGADYSKEFGEFNARAVAMSLGRSNSTTSTPSSPSATGAIGSCHLLPYLSDDASLLYGGDCQLKSGTAKARFVSSNGVRSREPLQLQRTKKI